jgi:DNA-binding beta-propeller fold protein YncE/cytochrome c peroxidase
MRLSNCIRSGAAAVEAVLILGLPAAAAAIASTAATVATVVSATTTAATAAATATKNPAAAPCELTRNPARSKVGDTVSFSLLCPAAAGKVSWDFGDGIKLDSGGIIARHVYERAGHFQVIAVPGDPNEIAFSPHTAYYPPTTHKPSHAVSIVYDAGRKRVYAVNPDHNTVAALDAVALTRLWEKPVGKGPRSLALDPSGRLWVACEDEAALSVLDGGDGHSLATVAMPPASLPFGIAFVPGTARALVTLSGTGRLVEVDAEARRIVDSVDLGFRARALGVTADGRIFAARYLSPADRGEVAEVSRSPLKKEKTVSLAGDPGPDDGTNFPGVPNALNGIAITPDGRYAWVASKKDNVQGGRFRDGVDLTFETMVRSITSQIDLATGREAPERRKDYARQSMAMAVAFTREGDYAFVAHTASNNVVVIDAWSGADVIILTPEGPEADRAPEGLVLDDKDSLLFVRNYLARGVAVWDVSGIGKEDTRVRIVASIPTAASEVLAPQVLQGKRVFYNAADGRMSSHRYISCFVCHMDGGADGQVWDLTQRGEGPRRTTSLQGRAGTGMGPLHWSGNFDEVQDFEHEIRELFRGRGFMADADLGAGTRNTALGEKKAGQSPDLDALAAYVASLIEARPSPYRNADGTLTEDGKAGRAIFNREDVGCARCHGGSGFTDSKLPPWPAAVASGSLPAGDYLTPQGFLVHDVGTLKPSSGHRLNDTLMGFDTPTLKGIWEPGPYLHDGSAATLMDVITVANPNDKHGKTSQLDQREREQLVAYLMQIDGRETEGTAVRPGSAGQASARGPVRLPGRPGFRFALPGNGPGGHDMRDARGRHSPVPVPRAP